MKHACFTCIREQSFELFILRIRFKSDFWLRCRGSRIIMSRVEGYVEGRFFMFSMFLIFFTLFLASEEC